MLASKVLPFVVLAAVAIGCGGAVATVDDGKQGSPAPAPTNGNPSPAPSSSPGSPGSTPPVVVSPNMPASPVPVPSVLASSYDQSCMQDSDCVAIAELEDCGCACPNAAISVRDQAREQSDTAAHFAACVKNNAPACGVDCASVPAVCDPSNGPVGRCQLATR